MTNEELAIQLPKLKERIPYDEAYFTNNAEWEKVLTDLLNTSKDILFDKLFPFDDTVEYVIPLRRYDWQLRCCVELFNLADKAGLTSYGENDISWTKVSDGLSRHLMNQLISNVGVPKQTVEEEEEEPTEPTETTEEPTPTEGE
jgi:hypothetical protein